MGSIEFAIAAVAAVWLAGLTLLLILVIRQIGLLTVRFGLEEASPGGSFAAKKEELAQEGPAVGSRIGPEVLFELPELAQGENLLLLLSSHCLPCRDLAEELGQEPEKWTSSAWKLLVLVPGREELAAEVATMLPDSAWVIRDPDAEKVARRLGYETVPAALTVVDGVVTAKAPLPIMEGAADIEPLVGLFRGERVELSPVGG